MGKINEELMWYLEAHNDDELSDGAWWCVLEDAVSFWNDDNGTKYDRTDTVHQWLKWREEEKVDEINKEFYKASFLR